MRRWIVTVMVAVVWPATAWGLFGERDDILFLYPSAETTPADWPRVVEGLKSTGIEKVLLLSSIVQGPQYEGLIAQIRAACWGQVGCHYYPYPEVGRRGDYRAQIERAKLLRCDWFGYADACDDIFIRNPGRTYEENQAEVVEYLRAVKASIRRQPALLMASAFEQHIVTGFGSTDMHEPILTFLPKQILRLQSWDRAMGTAVTCRRDVGWIGPPIGAGMSQEDWSLATWGWVLTECQRARYPMTLCLTTSYLARQPPSLRLIGDWKRETGRK